MRTIASLTAAVAILLAGTPTMAETPADLIRSFYEAVDDPEVPASALDRFFSRGFVDHDRPATAPPDASDRDAALALFAALEQGFPGSRHEIVHLAGIGPDTAMVHWAFEGRHDGQFFQYPASGRDVAISGVDIFVVRDGRFAEQWHVEDLLSLFGQIGG